MGTLQASWVMQPCSLPVCDLPRQLASCFRATAFVIQAQSLTWRAAYAQLQHGADEEHEELEAYLHKLVAIRAYLEDTYKEVGLNMPELVSGGPCTRYD